MKTKSLLFALVAIGLSTIPLRGESQTLTWEAPLVTSIGLQDRQEDLAVDSNGDCYVVGHQDDGTNRDAILTKWNSSGVFQFLVRHERVVNDTQSWQNEAFTSVVVSGGFVYALGYQNNGSNDDLILNKYTTAGALVWARSYNDGANEIPGRGLAVDGSGNLYILFTRTSGGTTSLRMTKYNTSGSRQWVQTYALSGGNLADSLAYDAVSGNLFATSFNAGSYNLSCFSTAGTKLWTSAVAESVVRSFSVDLNSNVYTFGSSGQQMIVRKYNSSGTQQWSSSTSLPSNFGAEAMDSCVDSSGNVYCAGYYQTTGSQWIQVIFSLSSANASRFYQEYNAIQYQTYNALGISSDGYVYAGGYSLPGIPGTATSLIDKFDTSGNLIQRRVAASTLTNQIFRLGFDTNTGVYSSGATVHPTSGDEKLFTTKF